MPTGDTAAGAPASEESRPLAVARARLIRLPAVADPRGRLSFAEVGAQLPFVVRRFWVISGVPHGARRGDHAHRELEQLFVCLRGSCTIGLDDGRARDEIQLDAADVGVYVPPRVWVSLTDFSAEALLFVAASDVYREAEYVRRYDDFLALVGGA
jgi:dTDP-4-dehydrorhamnose 3,5-epimerase-like enzyme